MFAYPFSVVGRIGNDETTLLKAHDLVKSYSKAWAAPNGSNSHHNARHKAISIYRIMPNSQSLTNVAKREFVMRNPTGHTGTMYGYAV